MRIRGLPKRLLPPRLSLNRSIGRICKVSQVFPSITYNVDAAGNIVASGSFPRTGGLAALPVDHTFNQRWQVIASPSVPSAEMPSLTLQTQSFLEQTRSAMTKLCEQQGYTSEQGRENMIYAMAAAGMEKG